VPGAHAGFTPAIGVGGAAGNEKFVTTIEAAVDHVFPTVFKALKK